MKFRKKPLYITTISSKLQYLTEFQIDSTLRQFNSEVFTLGWESPIILLSSLSSNGVLPSWWALILLQGCWALVIHQRTSLNAYTFFSMQLRSPICHHQQSLTVRALIQSHFALICSTISILRRHHLSNILIFKEGRPLYDTAQLSSWDFLEVLHALYHQLLYCL